MASYRNPHNLIPVLVLFSTIFLTSKISMATTDSLSLGQSLAGNQTLISNDGTFALGFFTPGNSHNFYIGVWYNKLPGQTIVWVANRESPVSDPTTSKLQISNQGNLVLLNSSNSPVWSSKSASKATLAILLNTGNLVLRSNSSSTLNLWQGFAYPTDTWMPGGWLGVNKVTGEYQKITSWKSPNDPSPGLFAESMNPDGSNEYVLIWNGSNIYWRSGRWNNQYFANVPGTKESTVFNFTFIDNSTTKLATYTMTSASILTRFVVDYKGQGFQWFWLSKTQQWQTEFIQPLAHCDVFSLCGPFGICDGSNPDSICKCAEGFKPAEEQEWADGVWTSGCSRKSKLQCQADGFLPLSNMRLPANTPARLKASNEGECREACLNNCSCTAYVYDTGCAIWKGELRNLQVSNNGGTLFYLRLVASDIPSSSSSSTNVVAVAVGSVAGVVAMLAIALSIIWLVRRRRKTRAGEAKTEGSLVQFTYSALQKITKNFTEKIGSGGFGSVFKGVLPNSSTFVAVKKLEDAVQGEKQFRAEVRTLGGIQHVNLVRLHGFCSEGNKRLLVYEHMPRSSLDSQLFGAGSTELDWDRRFQIVLGTARGLAYLHEECRECIVHCDVKPDNVLLDADYTPKVSDFGMAKLIGRDFSKVLTTMRGTVGYLAPEWIAGLPITPKVDVYSYGMMIFEVVSGKRNNNIRSGDGSLAFYPSWAVRRVLEGEVKCLLDERLEGVDEEQLMRVCRVACWCVQDLEDLRPGMRQVVQILEGGLEVNMPPMPAALQNMVYSSEVYSLKKEEEGERREEIIGESHLNDKDQATTLSR